MLFFIPYVESTRSDIGRRKDFDFAILEILQGGHSVTLLEVGMKNADILSMFSQPATDLVRSPSRLKEDDQILKLDIFEQGDEQIEFLNRRDWVKGMTDRVCG